MTDVLAQRALLFAGEMFAASALVMAIAWLAAAGRTASRRHLVWSAAFGALLLLPLPAALVPGAFTLSVPAPQPAAASVSFVAEPRAEAAPSASTAIDYDAPTIAGAVLGIWAAGVLLIALRGVVARVALWWMRRDSIEAPFEPDEVPELAGRVALRVSNAERGPFTWGILRPVVLLPQQALYWPSERLEAVLRHELAHVRRRDSLTQMLSLLACALYWPNPLVWLGLRRQRREAEMAADDAVLAAGMTPSDYAAELLTIAAEFRGRLAATPLSMAAPSALFARVQSVLAPTQQRSGVTAMDVLKMTGLVLVTTAALVAARPSLAQDAPSAPPAPAAAAVPAPPAAAPDAMSAPAPAAMPVPPVPPVPAAAPLALPHVAPLIRIVRVRHGRHVRETVVTDPGDVAEIEARVKPELERTMAEVRAHEAELHRIEAMRPQLNADIRKALADARAQVAQIDDAKIRARVDAALARAQKNLDETGARMRDGHAVTIERDGTDTDDK